MILKHADLALLKRGRRWFTVPQHPGWEQGKVVRLRTSRHDEGFVITVHEVVEDAGAFKIHFVPGDPRPEDRYIAAGWPDYTTDSFRAMRGESQPFQEDAGERKNRTAWLVLALKHTPSETRRRVRTSPVSSQTCSESAFFEAGSEEAVRVVRSFANG